MRSMALILYIILICVLQTSTAYIITGRRYSRSTTRLNGITKFVKRRLKEQRGASDSGGALFDGIVRIYCTHSPPDYTMPWQRLKQEYSTSSGLIIDGDRILTNAHAVEYGSLIQVKKRSSEKKFLAKVVAVGHECDLALLSVADAEFWEGLSPLKRGCLPDLQDEVSVIGYPIGGDSISISSGVVSRVEMTEYAQGGAELLAIQIDAAINPGNSGGPVFNANHEVIGVAFQGLCEDDAENIGYVIPPCTIDRFLEDVRRNGRYTGVCSLGARLQSMESEALRQFYSLTPDTSGVLVLSLEPMAAAATELRRGDVITHVDGTPVANDGTVPFRKGSLRERVGLGHLFSLKFIHDEVTLDVWRDGKPVKCTCPLYVSRKAVPRMLLERTSGDPAAAPDASTSSSSSSSSSRSSSSGGGGDDRGAVGISGGSPSYLMVGGLVFVPLSMEYLQDSYLSVLEHMTDAELCAEDFRVLGLSDVARKQNDEQVVLLSQVLAHPVNIGYETRRNMRLVSCNGSPVMNLRHLTTLINPSHTSSSSLASAAALVSKEQLVFEFANGQVIVLNAQEARAVQNELCRDHGLPAAWSRDLMGA